MGPKFLTALPHGQPSLSRATSSVQCPPNSLPHGPGGKAPHFLGLALVDRRGLLVKIQLKDHLVILCSNESRGIAVVPATNINMS